MGAKKELRKRLEAISTVQEGDHGQVVDLRHRISELEAQLRDLPVVRGEALRTQLQQVQGAPVPAFPGFPNFAQDQLRLGALATQEATQAPRTNLVPRLLSEFPIAPGHDALLVQEGTRLLSWQPGAAQMRLDWADADKPAAELVRVQWCLIARHGPVEINIGSPIRGSAFFGDSMIPVVADGEQVYVGGDVLFGARVYLDERAHGRPLCGAQIIVHHAELPCPVRRLLEELGMYTFPLVALAAVCVLALVVLNRRLLAVTASNRINADRITRDFVGVVAACAALGVVLQLLVDLHHLE